MLRDFRSIWAGASFIVIGASFLALNQSYSVGSMARMGPGFFPRVLASLLVGLGLVIAIKGWRARLANRDLPIDWRPAAMLAMLLVVAAGLAFSGVNPRDAVAYASIVAALAGFIIRATIAAFVLVGIALFGLLLPQIGFILSSLLLIGVSTRADRQSRPLQTAQLAFGITAMAWLVFVFALGLPLPLFPR